MKPEQQDLLKKWRSKLRDSQRAHYIVAANYGRLNYIVGVPVIFFTVLVGSNMFTELQSHETLSIRVGVGMVAAIAAILASLQTFLRFPERSEIHRSVALRYGHLKKDIDMYLVKNSEDQTSIDNDIIEFKRKWDEIVEESPTVPNKLWAAIKGRNPNGTKQKNKSNN